MVSSRLKIQYCKVIIITSLVWFLLDVFLLMYFTDCTMNSAACDKGGGAAAQSGGKDTRGGVLTNKPGILNRILPNLLQARPPEGPGEMGKAVVIPKSQEAEMKEKFKVNQFNLMASEIISVNRTLPDVRMEACRKKSYGNVQELPDTSVVIVFHNEAWTTLLRTIHSVINRSPPNLLNEIILVDDASEREFLGRQLEEYVSKLSVPVHVERMGKRSGLIRARLKGAGRAKGKIITFLDAHCECTEGWLEPLVYEIHKDRTAVVCPIIDVISDETFEYITGSDMTWGGFNWKLNFRWYPVPQREMERRGGDRSQPLRSPTMAGGLFAIERDYFYEIGSYDSGMDIWGGENLEMSFRIWMCGGSVLIATCSRVGHVFRKVSPYTWPGGVVKILNHNTMRTVEVWMDIWGGENLEMSFRIWMCQGTLLIVTCSHVGHVFRKATPYTFPGGTGKIINHNNARLAEVWMDEWKEFYYKINPGVRQTDYGDVGERKQLREERKCKSFRWYLENIYPESQMPLDYYSLGEIRNKETGLCLDSMGRKQGEKVGMVSCHGMGGNQVFSYTKKRAIQTDDLCLDVSSKHGPVKFYKCHSLGGNQLWQYDKQSLTLRHVNSNQCLDKPSPTERDMPTIGACNGSPSQQWVLSDMDWKKMDS